MKFDNRILSILKNYVSINPSMIFNPGNILSIRSKNKTILSRAKTELDIPKKFIIHDMSRFISTISLMNDPELIIEDKWCIITSSNPQTNKKSKVKYLFADLSLENTYSPVPDKQIILPSDTVELSLSKEDFIQLNKVMDTLSLPEIAIFGEDGKLSVQAIDSANTVQDVYEIEIGETNCNFGAVLKKESLKLIPADYNIKIGMRKATGKSFEGIAYFSGDNIDYWIALETSSYMDIQ